MNPSIDFARQLLTLINQSQTSDQAVIQTPEMESALILIFEALFYERQNGGGFLAIQNLNQRLKKAGHTLDFAAVAAALPHIFSTQKEKLPKTPFIVAKHWVYFRQLYQDLGLFAARLQRATRFSRPSDCVMQKIQFSFIDRQNSSKRLALNPAQQLAAYASACQGLSFITGGAGTGKTTTLAKALELILLQKPTAKIALSAPTGKAAQRLFEALQAQLDSLNPEVRPYLAKVIPSTLHRLLQISPITGKAYYQEMRPLPFDVIALDEASMIGSNLLSDLLRATTPQTQLIMMGDAAQLSAINALSLFNLTQGETAHYSADLLEAAKLDLDPSAKMFIESLQKDSPSTTQQPHPLHDHLFILQSSQRFNAQSRIGQAAQAVLDNQKADFLAVTTPVLKPLPAANQLYAALLSAFPAENTDGALRQYVQNHMILCNRRTGEFGSEAINQFLDSQLSLRYNRDMAEHISLHTPTSTWYEGRAIVIENNNPQLGLSNGDIGYAYHADNKQWWIDFGHQQLPLHLLPNSYRLAYALTIHKSQGSEYPFVDIVLDQQEALGLFADYADQKALLYTAITRAKADFTLWSTPKSLAQIFKPHDKNHAALLAVLQDPPAL